MKNVIVDFLRGVRTGLFYAMCLSMLVMGIANLCMLHKLPAWGAIVAFLVSLFGLATGCVALWLLGNAEKGMVDKDRIVTDIRRELMYRSEINEVCSVDNPLTEMKEVVDMKNVEKVLDDLMEVK